MKNQEIKKTWLNRMEKYMSNLYFDFKTKDLYFKWNIEKKKINIDGIDQECFVASIHLYKNSCSQMLIRQTTEALKTIDHAIDQINKFFADNFFSENICKF